MARIYTDTNYFINFYTRYRGAADDIVVFDELQKHKSSLVLTQQTIVEFRRNRVSTLNQVVREFKKSIEVRPYTTSIVRVLPGHAELTSLQETYKKKGKEVLGHLQRCRDDEKKDPVAQKFLTLAEDPAVMKLSLTDQAVDKAHRRKLLGNPPKSSDKYSVGDEVIWELLIENLKEDLVIVTEDHTFRENLSLLREEYERRTGSKLLLVAEKVSEALEAIGQKPPIELIEEEKKLIKWVTEGSGHHAAVLWNKVDDLIGDYEEEIGLEDLQIIPIMRLLAKMIERRCEHVEMNIRNDLGMETDEGAEEA